MQTTHIDQTLGVDAPGNGSIDQPYQSLAYAFFSTAATEIEKTQYLIRKDSTAEYGEPTQSAVKKAKKDSQGLDKKRQKAEEKEAKDRETREKAERRLQESKKIVLTEDPSLPQSIKVTDKFDSMVDALLICT